LVAATRGNGNGASSDGDDANDPTGRFSTIAKSASKLSSGRAHKATSHLPSYLLDARSITKYHPRTCPEGALQLSVAENQLADVPLRGIKLVEGKPVSVE
jgi:hypothetical protein